METFSIVVLLNYCCSYQTFYLKIFDHLQSDYLVKNSFVINKVLHIHIDPIIFVVFVFQ